MKNNLDWFKHKVGARNNWKFKALHRLWTTSYGGNGYEAEARFWWLNEMIAESSNCFLDISDALKKAEVAAALNLTQTEFTKFLIMLEECTLIFFEGNEISTQDVQDGLAITLPAREAAVERMRQNREKLKIKREEENKKRRETECSTTPHGGLFGRTNHEYSNFQQNQPEFVRTNISSHEHALKSREDKSREDSLISPENKFSGVEEGKVSNEGKSEAPPTPTNPKKIPEKKVAPPPKKVKETSPVFNHLKEVWAHMYRQLKDKAYVWRAIDYAHLKKIEAALKQQAKENDKEFTEGYAALKFNELISTASTMPWLKDHLSIPNIYSQINQIQTYKPEPKKTVTALRESMNGLYDACLNKYTEFYKKHNEVPPSITTKDEESMVKLIEHLKIATADKTVGVDTQTAVTGSLDIIFERWNHLEDFLKKRMNITDIFYNINRIIQQIKSDGKTGTNSRSKSGHISNFSNETMASLLDARFGKG